MNEPNTIGGNGEAVATSAGLAGGDVAHTPGPWIAEKNLHGSGFYIKQPAYIQGCCDLLEQGYLPGENEPDKATFKAAMAGALHPAYAKA